MRVKRPALGVRMVAQVRSTFRKYRVSGRLMRAAVGRIVERRVGGSEVRVSRY